MAFGRDEEGTKEWNRFWCSGKIEDYLSFKSCCGEEEAIGYAGFDGSDGNHIKDDPRGGV